jgi:hypothetical protein
MNIPNENIKPIASATVMRTPFGKTPEFKYLYHRRQLLSKNLDKTFFLENHHFTIVLNSLFRLLYHFYIEGRKKCHDEFHKTNKNIGCYIESCLIL